MKKLFYVRIDIIDLMDFATDPEGENMSLLAFAKELKKEKSEYPQIQRIINEAHCYINQKKEAGKKSAKARAKRAAAALEEKKKEEDEIERRSNGVATLVNGPPTNNSNSNSKELHTAQETKSKYMTDENGYKWNTQTGEEYNPFDEVHQ